jgi:RNA polymerase sigma-70 factor (ECF subfamily)
MKDDLLRMMFSCCNPRLPEEAQVSLVLNILCGFSVSEIAGAFVSTHAAIEKRIIRAKKLLATTKKLFDVASVAEFSARLPSVHRGASGAPAWEDARDLCARRTHQSPCRATTGPRRRIG